MHRVRGRGRRRLLLRGGRSRALCVFWPVAHAAYIAHVAALPGRAGSAGDLLEIDETRCGKPKWEQDPATKNGKIVHDRWYTAIVDAAGTGGLLDHIDGRTAAQVAEWIVAQPRAWRDQIT